MDITSRRLWIIRQILKTEDASLLQKIEYLLLTHDAENSSNKSVKEPLENYRTQSEDITLPKNILSEIEMLLNGLAGRFSEINGK